MNILVDNTRIGQLETEIHEMQNIIDKKDVLIKEMQASLDIKFNSVKHKVSELEFLKGYMRNINLWITHYKNSNDFLKLREQEAKLQETKKLIERYLSYDVSV